MGRRRGDQFEDVRTSKRGAEGRSREQMKGRWREVSKATTILQFISI